MLNQHDDVEFLKTFVPYLREVFSKDPFVEFMYENSVVWTEAIMLVNDAKEEYITEKYKDKIYENMSMAIGKFVQEVLKD